jgi:tRNA threonylcarbamoyladenosine biosynthesis protein TsaE
MKKTLEFTTASAEETIALGRDLAKLLSPPQLLILRGDLGAGKTTLVKGMAEGLEAADAEEVTSPTFTLIHEYDGLLGASAVMLYHLDLYRIESERELAGLGLEDLAGPRSVALVEWGEKFASLVERSDGEIAIEAAEGDARRIVLRMKE